MYFYNFKSRQNAQQHYSLTFLYLQQIWVTVTALHRMGRVNTPVLYVLEGPLSGDCVQGQETDDAVYPMVRCLIFSLR